MTTQRAGPVAGIVLAAGTSSRMGVNKLLLQLDDQTVLHHAVSKSIAAGLEPVLVVLGHEAARAREALQGLAYQPVLNSDYLRGMQESLRAGLRALPASAIATVVMLADMPWVTSEMLSTLVQGYRNSASWLAISNYEGVLAPPVLYERRLFSELLEGEREGHAKELIKRYRNQALIFSWPAAALADLDAPADYLRVQAEIQGQKKPP